MGLSQRRHRDGPAARPRSACRGLQRRWRHVILLPADHRAAGRGRDSSAPLYRRGLLRYRSTMNTRVASFLPRRRRARA